MRKVGFFGGSFDPFHIGHLALAISLWEKGKLDQILVCPALYSPLKRQQRPIATKEQRLEILRLSLELPFFQILHLELERNGPSYTVDTLRAIQETGVQYRLLLSEESALHLGRWKDTQELLKIAPPLIGERAFPVSSTQIRERLAKKLPCNHLLHPMALAYLLQEKIYCG